MLDRRKPIPLYIQLKENIVDNIREEVWEVGSKIPSEKELMKEYNIGRATVREAISILVNEGYLFIKKGIGTFVARKQPTLGFEPLISLTYSLKSRNIEDVNYIVQKEEIFPDGELLSRLKKQEKNKCYYLKRIRSINDIPIAIEESYFTDKFNIIYNNQFDLTGSLARILLEDLKITISKVEQTAIPRKPTEKEQKELNIDDNTLVFNIERWIYIDNELEPFYYLKFVILGDIYSFPY